MNAQERRLEIVNRLQEVTKLEPVVLITLKGSEYKLEFNNFAVRGIVRATGINLLAGFDPAKLNNDPDVRSAFLLWGLKTHHPEITEEESDKLQTMKAVIYVTGKLTEAIQPWFPDLSDLAPVDEPKSDGAEVIEIRPLVSKPNGSDTGQSHET